jgi:hypothetical protein
VTTVLTPTNGGATGAPTYDPFTYVDPSAVGQDANPVADGTAYTVSPGTNFAGATHEGADTYGPIDVTSQPVINNIFPARPNVGDFGSIEGHGFFGHAPVLVFQPKTLFGSTKPPVIPIPCHIEDDNVLSFGPIPSLFPANLSGGTWIFSNHRGVAQGKPVCDPSNVTGYSPTHAPVGTNIHILGTFGGPVDDIVFGGGVHADPSTIVNDPNGNYVAVHVPNGAVNGAVCIYCDQTCSGGDDCGDTSNPFIVDGAPPPGPFISGFSPTGGLPPVVVSIYGQGFTGTTRVQFGIGPTNGQDAASFTVHDDANITATLPANAQTGHIKVTTPAGSAQSATWFTVGSSGGTPVISSLTPNPCPQGVVLTIYGQGFGNLSPQGGVKYISGNSTFFLNGHWTVHNGGTQIIVDAQGTYSLPPNTSGKIHVESVGGVYDEHAVSITPYNPKLVVSAKQPFFQAGPNLIIAPGSVISTSPPADVIDAPGWLGMTAVAGLALSDLIGDTYRPDHYVNPPGSFTTPAKSVAGVAIPAPHPYHRTHAATVTAHWNLGKVVSLDKFRIERLGLMARTVRETDTKDAHCMFLLVLPPQWNEGRNEVMGNAYLKVTDARCSISVCEIDSILAVDGATMSEGTTVILGLGNPSEPNCAKSVYANSWHDAIPGPPGNIWTYTVSVNCDYFDQYGTPQSFVKTITTTGLNCGDANANIAGAGRTFFGCPNP